MPAKKSDAERPELKVLCMSGYPCSNDLSRTLLPNEAPFVSALSPETLAQRVRLTPGPVAQSKQRFCKPPS